MNENLKGEYGSLVTANLSVHERKNLLMCLDKLNPTVKMDFLEVVFGNNFLKFFDIYSGETFTVPKREKVLKLILDIKIYNFCLNGKFSERTISHAVIKFKKNRFYIKKALNRIKKLLEQSEVRFNEKET